MIYKKIEQILGDATTETSLWNGNGNNFFKKEAPFFVRGGYIEDEESIAGIFCYGWSDGAVRNKYSFRIALI